MKNLLHRLTRTGQGLAAWVAVLLLVAVGVGCQSVESTSLVADPQIGTPTVEELGEVRAFIEVVAPQPGWWAGNQAKRMAWKDQDYRQDLKRGFQAFEIPALCRPTLQEFMADPGQSKVVSPYIDIQVRERQQVTLKKRHQVISRGTFSRTATTRVEELPVWSWWRWKPDEATVGDEEISVVAVDLVEIQGLFSEISGRLDADGRMRVPLSPFLEHVIGSGNGLRLRIHCPTLALSTDVLVDQATLLHFQKMARQSASAGAWSVGK